MPWCRNCGERDLLIVLDNCEHLIDACAGIVSRLLRGCPRVSVLATSREPMRIESEVTWRTPSLALPDPHTCPALESLAASRLGAAVRPACVVGGPRVSRSPTTTPPPSPRFAIAWTACPWPLELAAACVPVLSAAADRRAPGRRAHPAQPRRPRQDHPAADTGRHAWPGATTCSTGDEQVLFRRLAVFAGSFDLDAVEGVCADESWRRALGAARARPARRHLAGARRAAWRRHAVPAARNGAAVRRRTAACRRRGVAAAPSALRLVRRRSREARDPEQSPNVLDVVPATLDVEHDNLRVALRWALRHEPATALRLAVALWRYWLARGLFAEGRRWLEAVLDAVPEPSPLRVRALLALAVFDVRRGTDRRLAEIGAESGRRVPRAGDPAGLADALQADAVLAYMRGAWTRCWQRSLAGSGTRR